LQGRACSLSARLHANACLLAPSISGQSLDFVPATRVLGCHHLGYVRPLTKLQELLASLRDHFVNVVEDSVTAESLRSRGEGNHRREGEGQEQESQTTRVGGQTGASTRGLMSSYRMRNASSTSGSSSASATPWTMERIFASWIPAVVVANFVEIESHCDLETGCAHKTRGRGGGFFALACPASLTATQATKGFPSCGVMQQGPGCFTRNLDV